MLTNFIKNRISFSETRGLDQIMILAIFILCSIGLVMVSSATLDYSYEKTGDSFHLITKHVTYLIMGIILASIIARIKLEFYNDYSKYFLVFSFLISLVVFIPGVGREINGATRWLDLKFITLQVTEISRIFILIWVCSYLSRKNINESFNKCFFMIIILSIILIFQKDLGSIILLVISFFSLILILGLSIKRFLIYSTVALIGIIPLVLFQPYRLARVISFLDPWSDPTGSGYQLMQSLLAFGKGGFFGLGLGSSVQKLFYLPESYNDFIFALIAEELGLVFTAMVVIIFYIIFLRIFILARKSFENGLQFAGNLAYMIGFLITFQSIIHIMVNIGLFPTKGMGLPFISYGGTNLISMFICVGILIRIQIENRKKVSQGFQRGF
ncbi:MAG: putative lipid II flippase FtsW [Gammaproteobacteria bacterium]|nr:putative lipid II flippase FtsW [Gammaproteobacteria bacterium]